jgi:hypothetical protein
MKSLFFAISTVILFLISGCDAKSCKDTVCGTNQVCNGGVCYCRDGYEGTDCSQLSATKFITKNGMTNYQWTVSENCQNGGGGSTYYTSFQSTGSSNVSELVLNNFLNQYTITGYVRGAADGSGNTIEFPNQQLGGSGTIYGMGTYDNNNKRITVNFEYSLYGENKACTHTFY